MKDLEAALTRLKHHIESEDLSADGYRSALGALASVRRHLDEKDTEILRLRSELQLARGRLRHWAGCWSGIPRKVLLGQAALIDEVLVAKGKKP